MSYSQKPAATHLNKAQWDAIRDPGVIWGFAVRNEEQELTWKFIDKKHTLLLNHVYDHNKIGNLEYAQKIEKNSGKESIELDYSDNESDNWTDEQQQWIDQWDVGTYDGDEISESIIEKIQDADDGETIESITLEKNRVYIGKYNLDGDDYPVAVYSKKDELNDLKKIKDDDRNYIEKNNYIYYDENFADYFIIAFYEEGDATPSLIIQVEKIDNIYLENSMKKWLEFLGIYREPIEGKTLDEIFSEYETLKPDEISQVRDSIASLEDEARKEELYLDLQEKVPYHNQRNNVSPPTEADKENNPFIEEKNVSTAGDIMCNLTSEAMCLEYLGIQPPCDGCASKCNKNYEQFEDYLECVRKEMDYDRRVEGYVRDSLSNLFNAEYEDIDLNTNDKTTLKKILLPYLKDGCSVLISTFGHIVRLQNITEEGLIVDDPYGKVVDFEETGCTDKYKKDGKDHRNKGDFLNIQGEANLWKWEEINNIQINYAEIYCKNN